MNCQGLFSLKNNKINEYTVDSHYLEGTVKYFLKYFFFSSPEHKLRVSYCHHPMSVVCRSSFVVNN